MNKLKDLRINKKLSQQNMADHLGVAKSTYSYWESGKIEMNNEALFRLSDFFKVSIDYLLGKSDNILVSNDEIKFDDLEFALFGEVREFDDELKSKILEYAQLLKLKKEAQKKKAEGK